MLTYTSRRREGSVTNEGFHFIQDKSGLQIKRGLEINERPDVLSS